MNWCLYVLLIMSKYFLFIFPKFTQIIITNIIVKIEQRHGDTNGDTNGGTNDDTNGDTNGDISGDTLDTLDTLALRLALACD